MITLSRQLERISSSMSPRRPPPGPAAAIAQACAGAACAPKSSRTQPPGAAARVSSIVSVELKPCSTTSSNFFDAVLVVLQVCSWRDKPRPSSDAARHLAGASEDCDAMPLVFPYARRCLSRQDSDVATLNCNRAAVLVRGSRSLPRLQPE